MIKYFFKNPKEKSLKEIDKPKVGTWISIENPSEKELLDFSEEFKLEADICLDALDPFEVPRIEREDANTYIFVRFAYQPEDKIVTSPILFICTKKYLITISANPLPFITRFLNNKIEFSTTKKNVFLTQLLSEIHREYQIFTNSLHKSIRNLSNDLESLDNKEVGKFVYFERILNDFLFGLEPDSITLKKLVSQKFIKFEADEVDLIDELFIENQQIIATCKSNLKGIVNIREFHYAVISNNLNKTMKLLTSMTVILTIPTMVSSFFGMNIGLPFQNHPLAFLGVLIFTISLSVGLLTFFIKRDLL